MREGGATVVPADSCVVALGAPKTIALDLVNTSTCAPICATTPDGYENVLPPGSRMPGVSDPPVGNAELDSAFTLTLQGGGEVATTTGSAETPTAGASQSCPDVHGAGGSHAGGVMVQGTDWDTATSVITAYLGGSDSRLTTNAKSRKSRPVSSASLAAKERSASNLERTDQVFASWSGHLLRHSKTLGRDQSLRAP